MKDYVISYTHSLGDAVLPLYKDEVAGVLANMAELAMRGHEFTNVTIHRL